MLNWRDPLSPKAGGAERVSLAHLRELVRRGHEVCWYSYGFPGGAPEEPYEGIKIVRSGWMFGAVAAARRWCQGQPRFDLVIDQHHGIPWYAPWWSGTRCLAYIHEVLGPIWNSFYHEPTATLGRWQERATHWLYRRVPFWTVCEGTAQQLRASGVSTVRVFYNGITTRALAALDEKPLMPPLRLVAVSRLAPNKRIDHALQALALVRRAGVEACLTIVGGGEDESRLRGVARDLHLNDAVVFTGPLPEEEKDAQLRQAHLMLHASVREGWGLNVIEANAMGTPAVVYPVIGLAESTLHRQTGLVVEEETPAALAQAVLDLRHHPEDYERYRRAAWERAQTLHWDAVLPRTCAWLEAVARGEPAGEDGGIRH